MKKPRRGFGSDNHSGVHPEVLAAIAQANVGHAIAYGGDELTVELQDLFKKQFGDGTDAFIVWNGTGANVLSMRALLRPHEAVICTETAHIHVDECGAPEQIAGIKLLTVAAADGKLTPELCETRYHGIGSEHHVQPKMISITQATELGTVYRPDEIQKLAQWAHDRKLLLHLDGARIANAAAALSLSLREATRDLGVDVLSFGGTKNGLMGAEAVVFFNHPEAAREFLFTRKQNMQLASKMRFISAQFLAYFQNDLWRKNAAHANQMAKRLADGLKKIPGIELAQPTEANGVFLRLPREVIEPLQKEYFFYIWNDDGPRPVVRLMCSFDTEESDIAGFLESLARKRTF